jgi:hypothetical protein
MEWWNVGPPQADQKDISHFNFIVNPFGGGIINPTLHYPKTHYSTIPVFHHSNRERSELTCSFLKWILCNYIKIASYHAYGGIDNVLEIIIGEKKGEK